MGTLLRRILLVYPGEGRKALLLFSLHLLFYLGLMWGGFAREALFLDTWGSEALGYIFIGNALLAFAMGLLYTLLADRVSNERILVGLLLLMFGWLLSVWLLLRTTQSRFSPVYPYFYLVYGAFSDLGTMHILSYINDFYDTRAAKRAIPLMLSAGVVGTTIAGFTYSIVRERIQIQNIPLIWMVCLLMIAALMLLVRRLLPHDVQAIQKQLESHKASQKNNIFEGLREGFKFVYGSSLMRWLALATLVMVVLMNLLTYQTSRIFQARFAGNPDGLSDLIALVDGAGSIGTLLIQSTLLTRLIALFGVGTMNILFPILTLFSVGLLSLSGGYPAAMFGRLDYKAIKQSLRNPLDAMLYNSVPVNIKTRARGFIGGLVVPLGTLLAGLLLTAVRLGFATSLPVIMAAGVIIALALLYVFAAIRIRTEYARSLSSMLSHSQTGLFQLDMDALDQADPSTIFLIKQRIEETGEADADQTVFLMELLERIGGSDVYPYLCDLASTRSGITRGRIVRLIGQEWPHSEPIRKLLIDSLNDDDEPDVRYEAVTSLAATPEAIRNEELLTILLRMLNGDDERLQASAILVLIASGDSQYRDPARNMLSLWLNDQGNVLHRMQGLRVFVQTGSERLVPTLVSYLDDPSPPVRLQAISLMDNLTADASLAELKAVGVATRSGLLKDVDVNIRMTAVRGLGHIGTLESSRALMVALEDANLAVRKLAAEVMKPLPKRELEQLLTSERQGAVECAAYLLARTGSGTAQRRLLELMERLVPLIYQMYLEHEALGAFQTPAGVLLRDVLAEQAALLKEQVLWLLSALSSSAEVQALERSLQSSESTMRANALETLEALTTPAFSSAVVPLLDGRSGSNLVRMAREQLGLNGVEAHQVLAHAWPEMASISHADVGLASTVPKTRSGRRKIDALLGAGISEAPEDKVGAGKTAGDLVAAGKAANGAWSSSPVENLALLAREGWLTAIAMFMVWEENFARREAGASPLTTDDEFSQGLQRSLHDDALPELVRDVARELLARASGSHDAMTEVRMLSTIEKMIFLKGVPFFRGMTLDQLRVLASISEEAAFSSQERIIHEGERGDSLFVIVEGEVAVQRQSEGYGDASITRLATRGPREYFAEMSIFDNEPYSEDAVALKPTRLLLVRQAPLLALVEQQPTLALELLRVLSTRLRQANETIAERSKTRTKKVMDFYDKMEEIK